MSLGVHPECISRLESGIAGILDKLIVNYGYSLNWQSCNAIFDVEKALPTSGPVRENIEQYISETPLRDFIFGFISLELHRNHEFDSESLKNKLTDLEECNDVSLTAKRLVSSFESLPWEYCVSFKLGKTVESIFKEGNVERPLSDTIRLVKPDKKFLIDFPLEGREEREKSSLFKMQLSIIEGRPTEWDDKTTYLQFFTKGFIGRHIITNPLEEVITLLKSFLGISIALRLFRVKPSYESPSQILGLIVHRKISGKWIIENSHRLDDEFVRTFRDIEIDDLSGILNTPEKKESWKAECIEQIGKLYSNIKYASRIVLAGRWFFESFYSENKILSFIQMIVALETLLGEKAASEITGLGELLRNRCAYLISKSKQQREEILENFKKIYELRCDIVHEGKCKLSIKDKELFYYLQWICKRVIQEEVKLILEE